MMINTAELHILILVYMTLTLVLGHRDAKKHKRLSQLCPNVINGYGWNRHFHYRARAALAPSCLPGKARSCVLI